MHSISRAIAAGLCLAGVTSAAHGSDYRLLEIGGKQVRWQQPDGPSRPLRLTYGFARGPVATDDATNCGHISDFHELTAASGLDQAVVDRAVAAAFGRWSAVANVVFARVADGAPADILIGRQTHPVGYAFADVVLHRKAETQDSSNRIVRSLICLNGERRWKVGFDGNMSVYDLTHTLTHEIGHALGLDHPGGHGHVMSFRYQESLHGLTRGDIEGALALFGPPLTAMSQSAGLAIALDPPPATE